jgi:hypothetical protein
MEKGQGIRTEQAKKIRNTTQDKTPTAESTASESRQSFPPSFEPNVPGATPSDDDRTRTCSKASADTRHRQALGECNLNKPPLDTNSPMQPLTPLQAEYDPRRLQPLACGVGKCGSPEFGSFVTWKQGKENDGKGQSKAKRREMHVHSAA